MQNFNFLPSEEGKFHKRAFDSDAPAILSVKNSYAPGWSTLGSKY